jgi:hypothetical protein
LVIGYGYAPLAEIERFGPLLASVLNQALASSDASSSAQTLSYL